MQRLTVIFLLSFLFKAVSLPQTELRANNKRLRLCVSNQKNDQKTNCVILGIEDSGVECVDGTDRADCLQRINSGAADFGVFGPEDLVAALDDFGTVIAELRTKNGVTKPFQSSVVAVVGQKILADRQVKLHAVLKDRTLCHPGIDNGQNSAYTRTLNRYLEYLVQPKECSSEEDRIKTLAEYFGRSCKAGPWVPDASKDNELKRRYPSLCGVCASSTCDANDRYWGSLGALTCVVEAGDVAWAEQSDVKNFFGGSFYGLMKGQDYALLCPDYTTQAISNVTEPCVWLHRPWTAVVARSNKFLPVQKILKNLASNGQGYWRRALGELLGAQSLALTPLEYPATVMDYLARARGFLEAYSVQTCEVGPVSNTFKCSNGQEIPLLKLCNGPRDCADGSDETASACRSKICQPGEFRCDYGACLAAGTSCNGRIECADGSDEIDKMCERTGDGDPKPVTLSIGSGKCVLPQYPAHGTYVVTDKPNAEPGQAFDIVHYKIFCNNGYGVIGNKTERVCVHGTWSDDAGNCVQFCSLNNDPSVKYHCVRKDSSLSNPTTRPCDVIEPEDTEVVPECNTPDYVYKGNLAYMRCRNGNWNYVAKCMIECGLVTPEGKGLVAGPGGNPAKKGEMPWHAGIYSKTEDPWKQICGGSLISQYAVISAAHCFWKDDTKKQPASNYAVALGKIHRDWVHKEDEELAQKSDVKQIHIPTRFQGARASFQHDIAILELVKKVEIMPHVRPVCVDFDPKIETRQLVEGRKGKIAGWGLKGADEGPSELLQVVELPYVGDFNCQELAPNDFKAFLTGDKICAGYINNGTALCEGDSGGGLSFPERDERGIEKFYLRGITSTSRVDEDHDCNVNWLTTFTQITSHQLFIKPFL